MIGNFGMAGPGNWAGGQEASEAIAVLHLIINVCHVVRVAAQSSWVASASQTRLCMS